jgi:hypothetical protein
MNAYQRLGRGNRERLPLGDLPSPLFFLSVASKELRVVKLRIRQQHTEGSASCRRIQQSRQSARVAPRPLTGSLRQQNLLLHIHHNQPLQPRTTRPGPVRMLLQKVLTEVAESRVIDIDG